MIIEIIRNDNKGESIDGVLYIGDNYICDTAENVATALPKGEYEISLERCKQYGRKMPVIKEKHNAKKCENCKRIEEVFYNTHMPQVCHMIKPGNGVYTRCDGSIIIGKRVYEGCLIKPKAFFEHLAERMRKALSRENHITLIIR